MREAQDAVLRPDRIRGRHALQRRRPGLDDEIVDRELEARACRPCPSARPRSPPRAAPGAGRSRRRRSDRNAGWSAWPATSRVAMVLRMPSSGTSSNGRVAIERLDLRRRRAAAVGDRRRARTARGGRSTSRATMRPCGPEPATRDEIDAGLGGEPARQRRHDGAAGKLRRAVIALGRAHLEERIELDRRRRRRRSRRSSPRKRGSGMRGRCAGSACLRRRCGARLTRHAGVAPHGAALQPRPRSPRRSRRPARPRRRRRGFPQARRPSVDGTSIDTLSVSISNRLSPGFTASPADLNHFVILPSATVSPSCGISTSMNDSSRRSLDPLPDDRGALRLDRSQDQSGRRRIRRRDTTSPPSPGCTLACL